MGALWIPNNTLYFFRLSSLKYNDKDGLKIIEKWGNMYSAKVEM